MRRFLKEQPQLIPDLAELSVQADSFLEIGTPNVEVREAASASRH